MESGDITQCVQQLGEMGILQICGSNQMAFLSFCLLPF